MNATFSKQELGVQKKNELSIAWLIFWCPANSLPLSEVSVKTNSFRGSSCVIIASDVASEVGPLSSARRVNLLTLSTILVIAPMCFVPIMLSSSQSPSLCFSSTILGRQAMSMRFGMSPRPAFLPLRLFRFLPCWRRFFYNSPPVFLSRQMCPKNL